MTRETARSQSVARIVRSPRLPAWRGVCTTSLQVQSRQLYRASASSSLAWSWSDWPLATSPTSLMVCSWPSLRLRSAAGGRWWRSASGWRCAAATDWGLQARPRPNRTHPAASHPSNWSQSAGETKHWIRTASRILRWIAFTTTTAPLELS